MYNQPIVTAPVALFLGAGASKPFGKMLMGEFITHLEKKPQFAAESLFSDIVKPPEGRDLEHLFEELDEWSRKGYCQSDDGIKVLDRGLTVTPKPLVQRLSERASQMQRDLRKEVFNAYRDFQPRQKQELVERFGSLFEVLLKGLDPAKSPLVIFTTNYDPAVEIFCQARPGEFRLCDGFVTQWNAGSPIWRRESIDQLQVGASNQKDVALFKLHGSTSWFKRETEFIKSDAPIYVGDDPSIENLLIYPAKKKVALEDPYFTGYDYFQRTLENCKLCVVIGYSFRDYDALSRLRSATSYNSGLRLLVLDTQADSLCKRLREQDVVADPLPKFFGHEAFEKEYLAAITAALPAQT